jgi:uncharacterized integral membrane protein
MPWKMIGFIVLLVLFAAFATLNISNRADISLGFYVFKEVPIFLSLLVAFLAGAVAMIPFTFGPSLRKLKVKKEKQDARKAREEEKKERQAAKEKKLEAKNERRQAREMKKDKSPAPADEQTFGAVTLPPVESTQEALAADNKKDAKKKKKKKA